MRPSEASAWNEKTIGELIVTELGGRLPRGAGPVDPALTFAELGLNSIEAVSMMAAVNQALGLLVPATVLFDHSSADALARHLFLELSGKAASAAGATGAGTARATRREEPLAVLGMGVRFPGADHTEALWRMLERGESQTRPLPRERFAHLPGPGGKTYHGGLLEDVARFEADLFDTKPLEAERMDPQQRLLLETAYQAVESAELTVDQLRGRKVGVFVGVSAMDYSLLRPEARVEASVLDSTGNAHSIVPNRLSYLWDLHGPSIAVDTACSSSLVALHLAAAALRAGECELALVGGVNVCLTQELFEVFDRAGMLAPDGRCKTFSEGANGYVRGEGCGVLLLGLSSSEEAKRGAWAYVDGTAVNQDGKTNGLTAPSGARQQDVIRAALAAANIGPRDVDYVEAHGTGTSLGDPVEYHALMAAYGQGRTPEKRLKVGSIKTLIGHLEAAAGVAGLIKAVLMLKHRRWIASRNFTRLNPHIQDPSFSLQVQEENEDFDAATARVGVSSFGFGGTNAHAILRSAPRVSVKPVRLAPVAAPLPNEGDSLLLLSAASTEGLTALSARWAEAARTEPAPRLRQMVAQALRTRAELPLRRALVWEADATPADLAKKLEQPWTPSPRSALSVRNRKVAFLFTGQGAQSVAMGRGLYRRFSVFRDALHAALDGFSKRMGTDLSAIYFGTKSGTASIEQTLYAQPCLFAFEHALLALLRSLGLEADFYLGHSLGELVALVAAGTLSLEDGVTLVSERARAMEAAPAGRMVNVMAGLEQLEPLLREHPHVSLAASNGARMTVLSGAEGPVAKLVEQLESRGLKTKYLKTQRAFHSALMEQSAASFERTLSGISFHAPQRTVISTLTGKPLAAAQLNARTWAQHIVQPTLFRAAVDAAVAQGATLFLEVGPHPTLSTLVKADFKVDVVSLCERPPARGEQDDDEEDTRDLSTRAFLAGLGQLFELGQRFDRRALVSELEPTASLPLPITPMRGRTFWLPSPSAPVSTPAMSPPPANFAVVAPPAPPAAAPPAGPSAEQVAAEVMSLVSQALDVPVAELNLEIPLIEYGADSLVLVSCVEKIRDRFGVELALADLLSVTPDLASVISHVQRGIAERHASAPAPLAVASSALVAPAAMAAAPAFTPLPVVTKVAPVAAPEGMGVLGNFRNRHAQQDEKSAAAAAEDAARLEAYRDRMVRAFAERTRGSKRSAQEFRVPLADNRVSAGFRPKLKEVTYPLLARTAKGAHFTDVDGNDYVDLTMGFGVNLFGHSPDFLKAPLEQQLAEGVLVGPQSPLAGPVAQLFCEVTGNERVAFVNSGTEAVMTAMRLARAATRRSKVVIFSGSYHGHFDGVLARPAMNGESVPVAAGIPGSLTDDVIVLEYGAPASLKWITDNASQLAAVLVEPVQSRYPHVQPKVFIQALRRVTAEQGCALVFDEVITGLRAGLRGAQGFYGVRADLATYGKILGGGFPIGAVAGSARFLDFIDGGFWEFGDESYPGSELTFFAGTFCKHPLAMAACQQTLLRLRASGAQELEQLNQRTEKMAARLNAFFERCGAPVEVVRFASLFRFKFTGNVDWLFLQMNLRGVYVWEGRNMFLSTAHSDADIEKICAVIEAATTELIEVGYLAGNKTGSEPSRGAEPVHLERSRGAAGPSHQLPVNLSQRRFLRMQEASPLGKAASRIGLSIALTGDLQLAHFEHAVLQACARHEVLTAALEQGAQGLRNVTRKKPSPTLEKLGEVTAETIPDFFARAEQSGAVITFGLAREGESKHRLLVFADHVFVDGLSIAFLMDDLAKLYSAAVDGKSVKLVDVYSIDTFLSELGNERQQEKRARAKTYWATQLSALAKVKVVHEAGKNLGGGRVGLDMSAADWTALKSLTFKTGCSLYTYLSLATQAAVRETLDQEMGSIGVPVAGHLSLTQPLVYNCVGLMPLTLPAWESGNGLARLRAVKDVFSAGLKASGYGADEMLPELGRYPFDVVVNVEPVNELPKMRGLTAALNFAPQTASELPLMLNAMKVDGTLRLEMDYQSAFAGDEAKARRLLESISTHARNIVTT